MVLHQIRVQDEYRYRDEQAGRVYTAIEARRITCPHRVVYLPSGRWDLCSGTSR